MDPRFKLQNCWEMQKSDRFSEFEITIRPEGIIFSKSFNNLINPDNSILIGFDRLAKEFCIEILSYKHPDGLLIYNCERYHKIFNKKLISFLFDEFDIPKENKVRICGKREEENIFIFNLKKCKN